MPLSYPSRRMRWPGQVLPLTQNFHSAEEERDSGIGENRIESQIAFADSSIGDVMETNPDSPGDRRAQEILRAWSRLEHKIEWGALFLHTGRKIGPEHTQAGIPIRHPSSEGKEVVFEEQGAARRRGAKRFEVVRV